MGVTSSEVPATRVMIVDDHQAFAQLLEMALGSEPDFDCVGTATNGAEAVKLASSLRPDIIVMDIALGAENGLDVTRRLREAVPDSTVVIVSAHREADWVVRAGQAGASAYMPKYGSLEEMLSVLRDARPGSMLVSASMFGPAPARSAAEPEVESLTYRETEVLTMMGRGMTPTGIAKKLGIKVSTCRGHVKSIHLKLGVRSQVAAVIKAQQLGIIGSDHDEA
jgi:DNA-binding NarL/FixJ family response regulator